MTKKDKAKSGTGRGTGKKGWTRWKVGDNKAKSFKPYTSKDNKKSTDSKADKTPAPGAWIDGD